MTSSTQVIWIYNDFNGLWPIILKVHKKKGTEASFADSMLVSHETLDKSHSYV